MSLREQLIARFGRERMILAARLAEVPLRILARLVLRPLPRQRHWIVFGAPVDRFADNSAYAFIALAQREDLRCMWISGSPDVVRRLRAQGLPAARRWSPAGLWHCLRAEWYVVCGYVADVNRWTHHGAKLLNLWHGIPLKVIERDIADGPLADLFRPRPRWSPVAQAHADTLRKPDVLLSPSAFISERCLASAFALPRERCLDLGYPRADHFLTPDPILPSDALVADPQRWRDMSETPFVVGYFPTWRDDGAAFLERSGLSVEALAAHIRGLGGVLLYKPHFNTGGESGTAPGLVALGPADDVHSYLPLCSVLITDYSSVAFEFMLLGRPILYYVPDLEAYRRGRGFYFPVEEMMPGPRLDRPETLFAALDAARTGAPADPRLAAVRQRVWAGYAGGAAARIGDFLAA